MRGDKRRPGQVALVSDHVQPRSGPAVAPSGPAEPLRHALFPLPAVSSQATSSADDGDCAAAPAMALCPNAHKNKPGLIKITTKVQEPNMFTQTGSESGTSAAASCSRSNLIPGFGFIMCLRRTPSNHTRRQTGAKNSRGSEMDVGCD